LGSDPI